MPELVKLLDLENLIVVADALNCQYEIANAIIEKNGNYVLALKSNKGTLYDDVKNISMKKVQIKLLQKMNYIESKKKKHIVKQKQENIF